MTTILGLHATGATVVKMFWKDNTAAMLQHHKMVLGFSYIRLLFLYSDIQHTSSILSTNKDRPNRKYTWCVVAGHLLADSVRHRKPDKIKQLSYTNRKKKPQTSEPKPLLMLLLLEGKAFGKRKLCSCLKEKSLHLYESQGANIPFNMKCQQKQRSSLFLLTSAC